MGFPSTFRELGICITVAVGCAWASLIVASTMVPLPTISPRSLNCLLTKQKASDPRPSEQRVLDTGKSWFIRDGITTGHTQKELEAPPISNLFL